MPSNQFATALIGASLLLIGPGIASCAPKASAGLAAKIAALKDLRDSGVITPEQYAQRAAELQGPTLSQASLAGTPSFGEGRSTHVIEDPQLGMAVSQVTIPADWRFEGSTVQGGGCSTPPGAVGYSTESPDGAYGVQKYGGYKYGMANNPQVNAQMQQQGCITFGSTVVDFLKDVWVPHMRPGAQIEAAGPLPDDDPNLLMGRRKAAEIPMPPSTPGYQVRNSVNGGLVKLSYVKDGRPVEEEVRALAMCTQTRMQGMMGTPQEQLDCIASPVVAVRTPQGRLDAFVARVGQVVSYTDNPAYSQRINQIIAQQGQAALAQNQAGIDARRNAQIAQGQAALDNIHRTGAAIMNNERASADALHASSQATVRSLGDQAQFTDANGQPFNASNQYGHTYVDANGRVLQTNSAYPPGPGWTETQGR